MAGDPHDVYRDGFSFSQCPQTGEPPKTLQNTSYKLDSGDKSIFP